MTVASWSHFVGSSSLMNRTSSGSRQTDSSLRASTRSASESSSGSSAGAHDSSNNSLGGTALLRSLPTDSSGVANNMDSFVPSAVTDGATSLDPVPIPRRNLSEAFEELYIAPPTAADGTPAMKHQNEESEVSTNMISPTGVADLRMTQSNLSTSDATTVMSNKSSGDGDCDRPTTPLPYFHLHKDLQRDLSQAVINRVSFYGIIHDINKEASAMAANDDSGLNRAPEDAAEECSPLVEAVKGPSENPPEISEDMIQAALIDEERWLLSAIETRGDDEIHPVQACPPTFLQAMGEREYENPLTSLSSGSRTQLWKPSRSWWEAKSGKNPWIEPKSHNKRWRYLWPLIHYHKFLAKCIKKLKRNGVDVKVSVSPVAAFLREEVCAVSDHLAAVSLFDSEEWMACLQHFSGWTDTSPSSQGRLRVLVSKLHLRPLAEHGDVESPLLRSQIDEQFLRAMAAARSQMEIGTEQDRSKHSGRIPATRAPHQTRGVGGPQQHPLDSFPPHMHSVPNHVGGQARATGIRRPRYTYPPLQWWGQCWHQGHHYPFPDDASVHSSLSGDAFSEYGVYSGAVGPNGAYYAPYHHPHGYDHSHVQGVFDPNIAADHGMYHMHTTYLPEHAGLGFFGHPPVDPSVAFTMQQHDEMANYYGMNATPKSPHHNSSPAGNQHVSGDNVNQVENGSSALAQTPYKHDSKKAPRSPYWGHLDAAIAMGLSTPQTHVKESNQSLMSADDGMDDSGVGGAQPLLLRQSQFYGYGPVNSFGPPSPATQFLMSPQANFAFNYGYGYSHSPANGHLPSHFKQSPGRLVHGEGASTSSSLKEAAPGISPLSTSQRKPPSVAPVEVDRESPSTVETITESETLSEAT